IHAASTTRDSNWSFNFLHTVAVSFCLVLLFLNGILWITVSPLYETKNITSCKGVDSMTLEYWIAVGIAVLALIILVAGSLIALKRIKNTLNNLQDFQMKTQQEMERYNSEADLINERVQKLNGR